MHIQKFEDQTGLRSHTECPP